VSDLAAALDEAGLPTPTAAAALSSGNPFGGDAAAVAEAPAPTAPASSSDPFAPAPPRAGSGVDLLS
jgi:hypothetical protein